MNDIKYIGKIPKHLVANLKDWNIFIETEEQIDDFMFHVYDTYEGESYASYNVIKAYLNPLTRKFIEVTE